MEINGDLQNLGTEKNVRSEKNQPPIKRESKPRTRTRGDEEDLSPQNIHVRTAPSLAAQWGCRRCRHWKQLSVAAVPLSAARTRDQLIPNSSSSNSSAATQSSSPSARPGFPRISEHSAPAQVLLSPEIETLIVEINFCLRSPLQFSISFDRESVELQQLSH